MCMGVTAGAYILTLFAVCCSHICYGAWIIILADSYSWWRLLVLQLKYKERVLGLILVSPLCKGPSWTEWLYNKVLLPSLSYARSYITKSCALILSIYRFCRICFISMEYVAWWRSVCWNVTLVRYCLDVTFQSRLHSFKLLCGSLFELCIICRKFVAVQKSQNQT